MALIRGEKLVGLFEQAMNNKAGVEGYASTFRKMLGIVEATGSDEPRIDPAQREVHPHDFSLGELWRAFKPRRFDDGDLPLAMYRTQMLSGLTEAEGYVVMPSHFANISAFSSTVVGLLDAMVMEAYNAPEFMGDQFFTPEESRMQGGKMIGVQNDGQAGEGLAYGEAYPTVGLKESFVNIPDNVRRGNTIQINELDIIYDRTGKIQQTAENAGTAVRRLKEIAQAKCFLGITNNYSRDGVASNTYLKVADFVPNNYVNSVGTLPITGFASIDTAIQTFNGQTDPFTGFEIQMPRPVNVAVMQQRELNIMTVARATEVERRTVDQTVIQRSNNPLYSITPVILPRLYFNLLVASGVSTTNAVDRWYAGDWKKAFKYRTIIAFENRESPLSSEDVRRDIIMVRIARELGTPWVAEPRWAFQGTNEA